MFSIAFADVRLANGKLVKLVPSHSMDGAIGIDLLNVKDRIVMAG